MFAHQSDKAFPTNISDHNTQLQYSPSQQALSQRSSCNAPDGLHRYSTMTARNSTTYSAQAASDLEAAQADVSPKSSNRVASCTSEVGGNDDLHQVWSSSASSPSSAASSPYGFEGGSRSIKSSLPSEQAASHHWEASPVHFYDENLRQPCMQDYLTPTRGLGLVDLVPANSLQAQSYSQFIIRDQNNSSTIPQPYTPSEYVHATGKGYLGEGNSTQCHVACTGSVEGCHADFALSGSQKLRHPVPRSHSTRMPPVNPGHRHQHPTERSTCPPGTSPCDHDPLQPTLRAPPATPHLLQAPFAFSLPSDCNFAVGSTGIPHDNDPASVGHATHLEDMFRTSMYTSLPEEMSLWQGAPCLGFQQPWTIPAVLPHLLQAPFGFSPENDGHLVAGAMNAPHEYEPALVECAMNSEELHRDYVPTSSSEDATLSQGTSSPYSPSSRFDCGDRGHPSITNEYTEPGYISLEALHHLEISHDPPTPASSTLLFHQPTPSIHVSALATSISRHHLSECEEVFEEHAGTYRSPPGTRIHHSFEPHSTAPRQESFSGMASLDGSGQNQLSQGRSKGPLVSQRRRFGNHSYNLREKTAPIHAYKSASLPLTNLPCEYLKNGAEEKDEGPYQDARAETALLGAIGTTRKGPAPALRDLTLRRSTSAHTFVLEAKSKLHSCDFEGCDRFFRRLEHKRRHERSHTQEKPFACDVLGCGRFFSRSDNLAQHKRTHAKNGRTKRVTNANLSNPSNQQR